MLAAIPRMSFSAMGDVTCFERSDATTISDDLVGQLSSHPEYPRVEATTRAYVVVVAVAVVGGRVDDRNTDSVSFVVAGET